MRPTDYFERLLAVNGWPVRLTSHKLGDTYYCKADNVSPGAWLARVTGSTREQAEQKALDRARLRLVRSIRTPA